MARWSSCQGGLLRSQHRWTAGPPGRFPLLAACSLSLLLYGCRGTPPTRPLLVSATDTTYQRASATFRFVATGPGDRDVCYVLNWGDGKTDTTLPWRSDDTAVVRHSWQNPGAYAVRAKAVLYGEMNRASAWSEPVAVTVLANGIPAAPQMTLPQRAVPYEMLLFRATTTDPDGDSVAFCFDFGDMVGVWTSFVAGGGVGTDSHRYFRAETVRVRCKAKDNKGSESDWCEPQRLAVGRGR